MAKYDELGRECANKEAIEAPLKFKRPPSIHEMIAAAVTTQSWKEKMAREGRESFEEANDFDVGDDVEPDSRYEVLDDSEFAMAEKELLDKVGKDMLELETLNKERKRRESGTDDERSGDGRESSGGRGKERAEVSGEGRSAGRSRRRVSEVRRGSSRRDQESSSRDGEDYRDEEGD